MYNECRHVMPSGNRCQSPALRGTPYCYFHTNLHRCTSPSGDRVIKEPLHTISIEDIGGIQLALTQVLAALNSSFVDTRRAHLLLRGLQIATRLVTMKAKAKPSEFVTTISSDEQGLPLAPEEQGCEPPEDCRNCANSEICDNYEDPGDDEDDESDDDNDEDEDDDEDEEGEEDSDDPEAEADDESDQDEEESAAAYKRRK